MLPCYNRGCEKDYDPENNPDGKFKLHFLINLEFSSLNAFDGLRFSKAKIFGFLIVYVFLISIIGYVMNVLDPSSSNLSFSLL